MSKPSDEAMSCESARAAMAAFFASGFKVGGDADRQEAMRRHMVDCEACAESYREMGQTAASLRGIAERRQWTEARLRGSHRASRPRARGLGAMAVFFAWNQKPPSSRVIRTIWRLRPVLLVAFFIFLMTQLTKPRGPGPRFDVEWTAGRILIDGKELTADLPNFGLARGGEVLTESDAGAVVYRADSRFVLHGSTHLQIEKVGKARVALYAGSLSASGPFVLRAGSVMMTSLESHPARLELTLEGVPSQPSLQLVLSAGELDVSTPSLDEHLVAPATLVLDRFGDRLPPQQ